MSGALARYGGDDFNPMLARRLSLPERKALKDAQLARVKAAGIGYVTGAAMSETARLDDLRVFWAGNNSNPALNNALSGLEYAAVVKMQQILDGLYGE